MTNFEACSTSFSLKLQRKRLLFLRKEAKKLSLQKKHMDKEEIINLWIKAIINDNDPIFEQTALAFWKLRHNIK